MADLQQGAWVRFRTTQQIPGARKIGEDYVGVYYPAQTVLGELHPERILCVSEETGMTIKGRPFVPVRDATNIRRCTDPTDIPQARLNRMGPIKDWKPEWPNG